MKVKVTDLYGRNLVWATHVFLMMVDGCSREEAEQDANSYKPGLGAFDLEELIEKYKIGILPPGGHRGEQWKAFFYMPTQHDLSLNDGMENAQFGGTPLTAVMRCILTHYVGEELDAPGELLRESHE